MKKLYDCVFQNNTSLFGNENEVWNLLAQISYIRPHKSHEQGYQNLNSTRWLKFYIHCLMKNCPEKICTRLVGFEYFNLFLRLQLSLFNAPVSTESPFSEMVYFKIYLLPRNDCKYWWTHLPTLKMKPWLEFSLEMIYQDKISFKIETA